MCRKYLTILALIFALNSVRPAAAEPELGQPAPTLVATTLEGKTVDLAGLKGKVAVVYFWATWCMPCREELPALEAVWRQYRGKGLEVLAISADPQRMRGEVDQVMRFFSFPAAMLSALSKNDFGNATGIPTTYVIAKNGTIADILTPELRPLTGLGLDDEVASLLDARTDPAADAKPEIKTEPKSDAKP